jgi:hypothetical protein
MKQLKNSKGTSYIFVGNIVHNVLAVGGAPITIIEKWRLMCKRLDGMSRNPSLTSRLPNLTSCDLCLYGYVKYHLYQLPTSMSFREKITQDTANVDES